MSELVKIIHIILRFYLEEMQTLCFITKLLRHCVCQSFVRSVTMLMGRGALCHASVREPYPEETVGDGTQALVQVIPFRICGLHFLP